MVYLDYNATTPVDKRVLRAMQPFFSDVYANPASDHASGVLAKRAVEESRERVANLIGAKSNEIIFTSGATEANNLALIGLALKHQGKKNHIITSRIEHPAILNPAKHLESMGFEITYISVDQYGVINIDELRKSITDQTFLVSIMYANNETGSIQPIKEIGDITRKQKIFFHTDAAQAVGHLSIKVDESNIDLMSMSAHKFYGPKGIGALFVRSRLPRVNLSSIVFGGGQERGFRSGTLNVPGIVGMGEACWIARKEMKRTHERSKKIIEKTLIKLKAKKETIKLNGHSVNRLPHTLNIEIPKVDNKWLSLKLKDFCFSTGSACSAFHDEPSHVLLAMGLNKDRIANCIRIGIGKTTTAQEVDLFVQELKRYI